MKDRNEIIEIINSRIRSAGIGGLTSGEDVRAVFYEVVDALFERAEDLSSYAKRSDVVLKAGNTTVAGQKVFEYGLFKQFVLASELTAQVVNGQLEYDGASFYLTTAEKRFKIATLEGITETLTGYSRSNHIHANATEATNGFMSKEDKKRLNDLVQQTDLITVIKIGEATFDVDSDTTLEFLSGDYSVALQGNKLNKTIQVMISFDKSGLDYVDDQDLERWKSTDLDEAYAPKSHTHDWANIVNKSDRFPITSEEVTIPWTVELRNRYGDNPIAILMQTTEPGRFKPVAIDAEYRFNNLGELGSIVVSVTPDIDGFILIR